MRLTRSAARRHVKVPLGVLLAIGTPGWLSAAPAGVDLARTEAYWRAVDQIGFRGVALVSQRGRRIFWRGTRDVGAKATLDLASIAKPLTAVAVLRLAARSQLSLDDPLARYFPDAPPDKQAITLHQLLTHTSGIGNSTGDTASGVKDRPTAVKMILATDLEAPPGREYGYSNDGYTLLAAVLEVVAGKTWKDVVRTEVLIPAAMEHTLFRGDPAPSGERAVARGKVSDGVNAEPDWGSKGGAGIFSTADDLARFIDALGGKLLGPVGYGELGQDVNPPDSLVRSSRVFRLSETIGGREWWHGGANARRGHYSMLKHYPDSGVTDVVFGLDDEVLRNQVVRGLLDAMFGKAPMALPPAGGRPTATAFKEPLALSGAGLVFRIQPGADGATLLPDDAASTDFLVASGRDGRRSAEQCVADTRSLLDRVARRAGTPDAGSTTGPEGRLVRAWREADLKTGAVREVRVLGAVPNWVDTLGGMVSFVQVVRQRGRTAFRLYWQDRSLRASGGGAIPNPAPLRLIEFGSGKFGAWHPGLGSYAELVFEGGSGAARHATLRAAGGTASLMVTTLPQDTAR